jgi:hypothetical protein
MMNISQEDVREGLTATRAPAEAARRIAPVMQRYAIALGEDNDRFGLIGREDAASPARILQRHILDSLAPWRILADLVAESGRRRLYDLGTGPGLPGIPLAFLLRAADVPLTETVLVERRGKRVTFLMGVVPALQARLSETSPRPHRDNPNARSRCRQPSFPGGRRSRRRGGRFSRLPPDNGGVPRLPRCNLRSGSAGVRTEGADGERPGGTAAVEGLALGGGAVRAGGARPRPRRGAHCACLAYRGRAGYSRR